ncbi:peptidoglycan-binding domain-containing protein [Nocardioides litoris]|uniref:peptidoglycan-binding domain-containing protein n=1 Tax=Nocardioides litoris TaxID=1926648 RepID=UPI001122A421|nr:peptidoglycan-binding domain-containing protein [Nocardioides litoris]
MAFLGADTDELREVGQAFEEGKETTDQVITYLKALIAILRAASFFSGGASAAYATYLETTVVPWLEKISQALGLIARMLGTQAQAQDDASDGGSVDYSKVPSYQTPQLPAPITPYQGAPLGGTPGTTAPQVPDAGAGAPATTQSGPRLTIGDNGHLMIDTGIDLDGDTGSVVTPGDTGTPLGTSSIGSGSFSGGLPASGSSAGTPTITGEPFNPRTDGQPAHGIGSGTIGGGSGGGTGGGSGGGTGGGSGGSTGSPLGSSSIGSGDGLGAARIGADPVPSSTLSSTPVADGGLGGAVPGAESLGSSGGMGQATPTGESSTGGGPSYGAAAGIAGGAAALGLGGAALASRGGGTDAKIDQLASSNGRGSRGEGVKELQQRLTAAGYDTKGADGVWGKDTQAAYDAYRTEHPLPVQAGQGYTSPTGYDYQQITGVRGNANVTPEFLRQVEGMSQRLGARPEHIMAAMSFETGGTFASDVRNPRSSATGLIQFMDSTARGLGTTTGDLARMSPTEQLRYVERYFEPHRGRLGDLESVYTSILAGRPHSGDDALFTQGERAYRPNRELDVDHDGVITAAEATAHVRARMGAGGN